MNMKKKLITTIIFVLLLSFGFSFIATANTYDSYYYDNSLQAHEAPDGYDINKIISLKNFGIENFSKVTDMECDSKGNLYILSSESGEVIVLDSSFNYSKTIKPIFLEEDNCIGANGIFIYESKNQNTIYFADTEHERIIHTDMEGNIIKIYNRPETTLLKQSDEFKPTKVVVNESGYIFAICRGLYSGAVIMNQEGDFLGFFGSNKIKLTASVIYDYFWKSIFGSSRGDMSRYVPIEISNLTIDESGFIYTITASETSESGIKLLNFSSENLYPEHEFGDLQSMTTSGEEVDSEFVDITYLGEGIVAVLDSIRNRVFVYNKQGDLLTVFGGTGLYKDTLSVPNVMASFKNNIYVYDSQHMTLSSYIPNKYGEKLLLASRMYSAGEYEESEDLWNSILQQNNGFQTAYISIGRTKMSKNDYLGAMEYFKLGNAKTDYSEALAGQRKQVLQKWFLLIFSGVILMICLIFYLLSSKRIKSNVINKDKTITLSYAILHPIKGGVPFLKKETILSKYLIVFVLPLWFLINIITKLYTGFVFSSIDEHPLDLRVEFIATIILGLTFIISNWLIVTMTEGNGKITEISTVVAMAIIPFLFGRVISMVLSNYMLIEESMFVNAPVFLGLIWSGVILINGLAKIHEFTILQTFKNIFLTIFGMAAVAFLLLLEISILKQIQVLIETIFDELVMIKSMGG